MVVDYHKLRQVVTLIATAAQDEVCLFEQIEHLLVLSSDKTKASPHLFIKAIKLDAFN